MKQALVTWGTDSSIVHKMRRRALIFKAKRAWGKKYMLPTLVFRRSGHLLQQCQTLNRCGVWTGTAFKFRHCWALPQNAGLCKWFYTPSFFSRVFSDALLFLGVSFPLEFMLFLRQWNWMKNQVNSPLVIFYFLWLLLQVKSVLTLCSTYISLKLDHFNSTID